MALCEVIFDEAIVTHPQNKEETYLAITPVLHQIISPGKEGGFSRGALRPARGNHPSIRSSLSSLILGPEY